MTTHLANLRLNFGAASTRDWKSLTLQGFGALSPNHPSKMHQEQNLGDLLRCGSHTGGYLEDGQRVVTPQHRDVVACKFETSKIFLQNCSPSQAIANPQPHSGNDKDPELEGSRIIRVRQLLFSGV